MIEPGASAFARAAARLAGTRYGRHGRGPDRLDCAGLVVVAAREVGVDLKDDWLDYDEAAPDADRLRDVLRQHMIEEVVEDAGEGRVGLCVFRQSDDRPRHLVVMLRDRQIAHVDSHSAVTRRVVVVSSLWLEGRLRAVYRLPGLEYGPSWR